jgi:hypothetical protein
MKTEMSEILDRRVEPAAGRGRPEERPQPAQKTDLENRGRQADGAKFRSGRSDLI